MFFLRKSKHNKAKGIKRQEKSKHQIIIEHPSCLCLSEDDGSTCMSSDSDETIVRTDSESCKIRMKCLQSTNMDLEMANTILKEEKQRLRQQLESLKRRGAPVQPHPRARNSGETKKREMRITTQVTYSKSIQHYRGPYRFQGHIFTKDYAWYVN